MRPSDTPVLFGSSAKIRQHTGWQPHIHLRQSLADTLDWWLGQLADGEAA
jgi:GDP-4-dehydro-6-deoxy-D-mannose reductase